MDSSNHGDKLPEIFSRTLRAGRRTYFFDVRETKAGDYYLTITESKKNFSDDGEPSYRKHKIYLYKEDFGNFMDNLKETTSFILDEKGEEVISEKHQKDYYTEKEASADTESTESVESTQSNDSNDASGDSLSDFTDVDFEDI